MNSAVCSNYTVPGGRNPLIWPVQQFPGNLFPGWDSKRRMNAQQAWNFYEQVESSDAATRVRLSGTGWAPPQTNVFAQDPSIWYSMQTEGAKTLYHQGLILHEQACPCVKWVSQRSLGISTTSVTTVYLSICPNC